MKNPIYKLNDSVQFVFNSEICSGNIAVIDKHGCFEYHNEPCYDIQNELGDWYKHVHESDIIRACSYDGF